MRRLLATVAIAATLLLSAGCSSERPGATGSTAPDTTSPAGSPSPGAPGGGSAPAGSPAPGGVTGTAGGNAAAVCAAATKASTDSVQTFVEELGRMLQASGANDTAAARTAQRKAEAALAAWGTAMKEQSAKATDPRLKGVLAEIGAEVGGMKASIESVDASKLDELQQRLDQLCGS